MFNKSSVNKAIQYSLLLSSSAAAFSINAAQQQDADTAQKEVERIQVTGSRIARPELSQAAPLMTVGQADIARAGSPDLGQILAELPAIGATDTLIGNRESNASAGVSSADLRRMGASRTLTLVNGKRHVAGSAGSAAVDLSTIPAGMIERVEIITGGASAVYGSDAVSGVVNVILKDGYEGFEVTGQANGSTEGVGARSHEFSLLGGGDFMDGRGNATFFAGLNRSQETMENDIRQFENWGTVLNPADTGPSDGNPKRFYVPNVGSEFISGGGVINADQLYGFFPDGSWQVQPERDGTSSGLFGSFPEGCDTCLFTQDYSNYQPEVKRFNVGSMVNFEINDNARFYSDFKYSQADITQQFQPSFSQSLQINVADNPYLDETLRQHLLSEGVTTAKMSKFFEDWGNRTAENERSVFRFTSGIDGAIEFSDTFLDYDIYYGYGETKNTRRTLNSQIPGNMHAAIDAIKDANGNIVCRDIDAGSVNIGGECVPYNPFGDQASQAAVDFMSADVQREDTITQEYFGASFVTDTASFLEFQGGPIGVAFGFEWREETSQTLTDEFTKRGLTRNAATPDEYGEFDVTEGFVEVNLPILAGVDFAEELTLDLAYRAADYSHAGSTDAWKIGFMYAPIDQFRIRGTYGVATRAPNITEAFSPRAPGFTRVTDPCDKTRVDQNANRAANCAALGVSANFESSTNASIDLISGGNPELQPEESDSYTLGTVWTPTDDLSFTLDYYSIEITDAITFIDPQDVINNCVDSATGINNTFCAQVTRGSDMNLTNVESGYLNAASLETAGYEFEVNYRPDIADFDLPGELRTKLFINYVDKLVSYSFQDQPDLDDQEAGELGDPEWQARFSATYQLDDFNAAWTTRYIDSSALFDVTPRHNLSENVGPNYVGSITTHDLGLGYAVDEHLNISGGIRNLFDKVPPGYVGNALYDLVGRRAYVNFQYRF